MILGGYTFEANPYNMPVLDSVYVSAHVQTYAGCARFAWGEFTAGQLITLEWDLMTAAQWDTLQALWVAGEQVVFDPDLETPHTFNVFIENLTGTYWESQGTTGAFRSSVKLDLLVMSAI
jgi:hypothetical protein